MQAITSAELLDRYDTYLIDAYGVLVTSQGALPNAAHFIEELNRRGHRYMIVTNDASRSPETASAYYRMRGVPLTAENVLTAGVVIGETLNEASGGKPLRCIVLGPLETQTMVERAGHVVVPLDAQELAGDFDALVVGDDSGFDFLPTLNKVITALHRSRLRGRTPLLLLPNADLMYPAGPNAYGFTSGAIATLLEHGLAQLHPEAKWSFETLGKPARRIFDLALKRMGYSGAPEKVAMLGDQLHTDVLGANRMGFASVILGTGITPLPLREPIANEMRPKFILANL